MSIMYYARSCTYSTNLFSGELVGTNKSANKTNVNFKKRQTTGHLK